MSFDEAEMPDPRAQNMARQVLQELHELRKWRQDATVELSGRAGEIESLKRQLEIADQLRGSLHDSTVKLARDMVVALEMLESAYHEGYRRGAKDEATGATTTLDAAFREWFKDAVTKMPKPGVA